MSRRILSAALVAYTAFVLLVTLSPRMPGTGSVAVLVNAVLGWFHERGLLVGVEYLDIEFLANVGMFVPLGVLTALLMPRRARWTLLLIGTAFSGFIEAYQALFLPGRYPELRDVLSNSTGFLLGAVVTVVIHRFWSDRRKSQPEAPRV
ncbi:hypothetical protein BH09ACT5_BH09ACT5_09190 [soil metagenome]